MASRTQRECWDLQASYYASEDWKEKYGRFLALYEESCWRYIQPVLPPVERSFILEVGCGTGRWVMRLAPMGYDVVLSDLSPDMVLRAREKMDRLGLSDQVVGYHALDICDMYALADGSFDLVLALGGPLSLCRDAGRAVAELRRVSVAGGYVICDAGNRYRTALNLFADKEFERFAEVLDTGRFARRDGLTDHRFAPQELADLFEAEGMEVVHLATVCPFFDYLPEKEQNRTLDDEEIFAMMLDVGGRHAENPSVVGLGGRLLIVARKLKEEA